MKHIKFISKYTQGVQYHLLVVLLVSFVYVGIVLINPLLLQFTVDHVIGNTPITQPFQQSLVTSLGGVSTLQNNLWILALVVVVLNMVSGLALFLRGQSMGTFAETFTENVRNHLYQHLQILPYTYHVNAKTGDLIQRWTSDVDQINRFLNNQIRELMYAVLMVIISVTVLFKINVKMAWISMIAFPIIFVFALLFFKKMQVLFKESDEAEAELSNVFQESLDAVRVVKAFNRERFELDKFERKNRDYRDKTRHLIELLAVYWGVSDLICFLQILLVLIASIFEVRSGAMSVGNAIVFVSYISMVLWPIRNVGRIISDMGKVTVAIDRLEEILNVEPEDLDKGIKPEIKGNIVFDNVSFMYDDGHSNVLNDVSFTIEAGQTVAIMGPTGSGKSSLVHLLTRIYDVTKGNIIIDGTNINEIAPRYIRSKVGIVLQEPYLFSKSIYENIRVATPDALEFDVHQAAQIASIHDVIESFDQGYETMVGEKGVTLSGGQKQRVAIARTVINKQPIVIFDDSLSALDSETDAKIRAALQKENGNATTIIITHRVNSAQNADKILVINKGEIVQTGTHTELMSQEGLYHTIAKIQNVTKEDRDYES
ncbi:MAG: ABC transporter ATP-binding protein [Erysipelothrix sp.]